MSNIKTKIAALIAKAKGTDNQHEAEAFMGKAQELLEKHQLEMWELNEDDPMDHQFFGRARVQIDQSERRLLNAVAKLYGCKTVETWVKDPMSTDYRKKLLDLIGRESGRITTELMWPFIMDQVRKLAKQYNADHKVGPVRARHQIMLALSSRIHEMLKAQKRDAPAEKNALIIVDEVNAFTKTLYPVLKNGRRSRYIANASDYAEQVSLHRQTSNQSTHLLA